MSIRSEIIAQFTRVAQEQDRTLAALDDDLPLLHSGLDSLCLAVVVARLEDLLGVDPFNTDKQVDIPVTVGGFVKLYESFVEPGGLECSPRGVSVE